jgi:hypothetical protein
MVGNIELTTATACHPAKQGSATTSRVNDSTRQVCDFSRSLWIPTTALLIVGLSGCVAGEIRDRHAAAVESYLKTPFIDAEEPFADPARALGPPDGRTIALGRGASITVRFFREIPDGLGPDLRIYEVGPDGAQARVAVSAEGTEFFEYPTLATGTTTELDLEAAGLPRALFVRVRGVDDLGIEPGFDLDAVEALH